MTRKSGILLPVSSLPSPYGIGCFSKHAYEFIDFLEKAGQSYWQILPLGPTGYGDSPYQSFSTFAGNPYYIDLEALIDQGLLTREECEAVDWGEEADDSTKINYEKIFLSRFKILRKAYQRSKISTNQAFREFIQENAFWLEDYALYMAIKDAASGISWTEWAEPVKLREKAVLDQLKIKYAEEIEFYQYQQFVFREQWSALKKYANGKGIEIIGDIPIYVAFDSADTWANPELFQLDEECVPIAVAGCPPDAFAATGQLWGNPLYRWEYHKKTGYVWWLKRIDYCCCLADVVRIDHFRGFDEYYAIPYGDPTAQFGHWEKGPGIELFDAMKAVLGHRAVIAEDLGFLTASVLELVEKTGYPGMKVLQFAFDSREESDYLPHNYSSNAVVYTGTHDNDTTLGWYQELNSHDKQFADRYLNIKSEEEVEWEFIRAAMASVAAAAVIPMPDYLGLDSLGRINTPSTLGCNWLWRMSEGQCSDRLAERIKKMTKLYGRC